MVGVYDEILTWSKSLPSWQRDALRRLVSSSLTPTDLDDLLDLCLTEAGLARRGTATLAPLPLDGKHLPQQGLVDVKVTLGAISSVRNANLLAEGASIPFAQSGLTVIYGDNASGKSGYVRILKKACRARDAGRTIHPNVFEHPSGQPASATVTYCEDDGQPVPCDWRDTPDTELPPALSRVSVFDANCAAVYVAGEHDIIYSPLGLDLFDGLAQAADKLRQRLDDLLASRPKTLTEPAPDIARAPVLESLLPLKASTTAQAIAEAGRMSPGELEELARLKRSLREETPLKRAASIRARKALLDSLLQRIRTVSVVLRHDALVRVGNHITCAIEARQADDLARDEAFAGLLPGTGSGPWKLLWDHARTFSEQLAYPDHPFPHVTDDARCVLCQQSLSDEATARLKGFQEYVKAEAAARAGHAESLVARHRTRLSGLALDYDAADPVAQELPAHDGQLASSVGAFFASALSTREALVAAIDGLDPAIALSECILNTDPIAKIIAELEAEAAALEASADTGALEVARTRLTELEARQWAANNQVAIAAEVERLGGVQRLEKARKSTDTMPISRKAGQLAAQYVTADLQQRIEEELARVGPRSFSIGVSRKNVKGVNLHRLEIRGVKVQAVPIEEIVSEGEFCAIALAAFLAELGQSDSHSAAVLDDPVCSLDHLHRAAVAARLADEASVRQVIVFTHDLVFLNDLLHACEERGQLPQVLQVRRTSGITGLVSEEWPWQGKSAAKRVDVLREQLSELRALHGAEDEAYQERGAAWYGLLRESWERAVEELVLNSVVIRFSHSVQTMRIKPVIDLQQSDCDRIYAAMTKTSKWLPGHDQSAAVNAPVPPPDDLESDLDELGKYVKELMKRDRGSRQNML